MRAFRKNSVLFMVGVVAGGLPLNGLSQPVDSSLSFFITSVGVVPTGSTTGSGNLGGLSGADAHCQELAAAVNAGSKVWRAYLSTQPVGNTPAINARDRIGTGPWFNANKVKIASNLTELHAASTNLISQTTGLTQTGAMIPTSPNQHDMLTGTRANGTAYAAGADSTCANWTSSATTPARAMLGHFNRMGVAGNIDPASWVEAHISSGCTVANLVSTGGAGLYYCFAANTPTGIDLRTVPKNIGSTSDHAPYILGAGPRGEQIVYRFALDKESRVEVCVYDLEGQRRAVLMDGKRKAGDQEVRWDGKDAKGTPLPSGVYLIVLKRDGQISTR